jgi:LPXTG-motif cell wall-anchored protein
VLEVPEESTIVSPGETLCNTDLGLQVSYVVEWSDEGKTIVNNAVVTVRTTGVDAQAFQAADPAELQVVGAGQQAPTTTTLPDTALARTGSSSLTQLIAGALALAIGGAMLMIGRRRSTN